MSGQREDVGLEAIVDHILVRTGFDEFIDGESKERLYRCLEDYLPIPSITEADTNRTGDIYFVFGAYSHFGKELKQRCRTDGWFRLPRILMGEASVWVFTNNKEALLRHLERKGLFSNDIYAKTLSFQGADLVDYSDDIDDIRFRRFLLKRASRHLRESVKVEEEGQTRLASIFTYMALTRALIRRFRLRNNGRFLDEARRYYSKALLKARSSGKVIFDNRKIEIEGVLGCVE